jgi:hypothetical protein
MLEIGQEVVIMSAPGRFRIVEIEGDLLTIENDLGVSKKVRSQAVRVLPPRE